MKDIIFLLFSLLVLAWLVYQAIKALTYKDSDRKIFHGGAWISSAYGSWPFGLLLIGKDDIVLRIQGLNSDLVFTRENLEKIEIKKYFLAVRFIPRPYRTAYFYYGFKRKNLEKTLMEFGWL